MRLKPSARDSQQLVAIEVESHTQKLLALASVRIVAPQANSQNEKVSFNRFSRS